MNIYAFISTLYIYELYYVFRYGNKMAKTTKMKPLGEEELGAVPPGKLNLYG